MKNLGSTAFLTKLHTLFALTVLAWAGPAFAGGTVLFGVSGTLPLTNTLTITQDTVLDAHGFAVTISGGGAVRLFQVLTNVSLTVNGLTLADGSVVGADGTASTPPGPGQDGYGGGILSMGGTINLTGSTLSNNIAEGGNGADAVAANGGSGFGAAICSFGGWVNVTNCSVTSNTATGGYGGVLSGPWGPNAIGGAGHARGGPSSPLAPA